MAWGAIAGDCGSRAGFGPGGPFGCRRRGRWRGFRRGCVEEVEGLLGFLFAEKVVHVGEVEVVGVAEEGELELDFVDRSRCWLRKVSREAAEPKFGLAVVALLLVELGESAFRLPVERGERSGLGVEAAQ